MARARIPDAIQRRELLEQELDAGRALKVAEAYLEEGRFFDALAFLDKAGDLDRLRAIRDEAIRAGDVFLLREAAARCGEEPDADTWRALAEAAASFGKDGYAQEARRQLAAREAT
jgi:hypothetical protein